MGFDTSAVVRVYGKVHSRLDFFTMLSDI